MGPCFKTYFSYKFDQPERIHDQAIMRFSKNYFEPSYTVNQKLFVGQEVVICHVQVTWGSKGGAVVRALASHQCGLGLNPGIDTICGLSLLLVLSFAPTGFLPALRFSPLLKNQHFQIPIRSGTFQ